MKISVDREWFKHMSQELEESELVRTDNYIANIYKCFEQILRDNPEPTTKQITPQETVEFLIEITDTLAAYLWNKKEEVTTHKYANYLYELRGKLEEYKS